MLVGDEETRTFVCDAAGNRTGVVYPDAAGNGQGAASGGGSRELAFVHDRRNLLSAVIDGNPAAAQTTYTYDLSGNRTQLTLPNGVTTLASFDPLNRVTLLENVKMGAGGADAYEVGYTYDLAGNRVTADEVWDVGGTGTSSSKDTSYGYDALYRLTSESYALGGFPSGNGSHAYGYTYDDSGNRLTKTVTSGGDVTATAYAYDDLNRLLSEGGHTYTYDRNGNRTGKSEAGGDATTYTYDTHDRMVAVDRGGQQVFDAEYDYRTRRLAKTEGAETTVYRYDGGTSFQEVQDGVITLELIRGTGMGGGIGSILYTDRHDNSGGGPPGSLTTEYFAYNAVGHTVALTDTSGNVTKTNAYEAFGSVVAETGSSTNNKLANTKERDTSTALDNHGFRYYDPSTGLYITRDPIGYGDGLNVYLYVGGNPVNSIDPQGLQREPLRPQPWYTKAWNTAVAVVNPVTWNEGYGDPAGAVRDIVSTVADPNTSMAGRVKIATDFQVGQYQGILDGVNQGTDVAVEASFLVTGGNALEGLTGRDLSSELSFQWSDSLLVDSTLYERDISKSLVFDGAMGTIEGVALTKAVTGNVRWVDEVPAGSVKPGDRGTFNGLWERKRQLGQLEPVEMHEMPSFAAKKQAFRNQHGRPPTRAEEGMLRDAGATEAVTPSVHRQTRTYGGRNTRERYTSDAADLSDAQKLDEADLDSLR